LKYGRTEEALSLLETGEVGINDTDINGVTALHLAVIIQKFEYIGMLLKYGADPNGHDNLDVGYCTPLHRAAENESLEIVRALVEGGADVNVRNKLG
jgi:ankyrin repeat protein